MRTLGTQEVSILAPVRACILCLFSVMHRAFKRMHKLLNLNACLLPCCELLSLDLQSPIAFLCPGLPSCSSLQMACSSCSRYQGLWTALLACVCIEDEWQLMQTTFFIACSGHRAYALGHAQICKRPTNTHRNQHSFNGLSLALYGLASQAEAFERVCMLPAPTSFQLVQAALQLLGSGYDAVSLCSHKVLLASGAGSA